MKKRRLIIRLCIAVSVLLLLTISVLNFIYCTPRGYRMTVAIHGYTEIRDGLWLDNEFTGDSAEVFEVYFDACDRVRSYYGEMTSDAEFIITESEEKLKRIGGGRDILTFAIGEVFSYISVSADSLSVDLAAHELMHAETHERLYSGTVTFDRKIPAWFDEGVALQADHGNNYTWGKLMKHTDNMKILPDFEKLSDEEYFYNSDDETVQYNYIVSKFEVGRWIDENGGFEAVTELIEGIRKGRNFGELYEVPSFDKE